MIILRQKSYSVFGRAVGKFIDRKREENDKTRATLDSLESVDRNERRKLLGKLYGKLKRSGVGKFKGSDYEFDPTQGSNGAIITTQGGLRDNPILIAHEAGHSENWKTKAGRRRINTSLETPARWDYIQEKYETGKTPSLKKALTTALKTGKQRLTQVREESKANKNGLRLLKESGATKKTLDLARKTYKLQKKTYRNNALTEILEPLKNY